MDFLEKPRESRNVCIDFLEKKNWEIPEKHNFQPEIEFKGAEHWGKGSVLDTRNPADGYSSITQVCDYLFESP